MKTTQPISRSEIQWTIAPVLAANNDPVRPEWIRIPSQGECRYTSLRRTYMHGLVRSGAVKSVLLRRKGMKSGIRLIHLQSLLDYIESQKP